MKTSPGETGDVFCSGISAIQSRSDSVSFKATLHIVANVDILSPQFPSPVNFLSLFIPIPEYATDLLNAIHIS